MMNSYERVMATLQFKEPDRVPMAELLVDKRIYTALMPEAKEQCDFEEAFGLDVISTKAWYKTVWDKGPTFMDEWGITYQRNSEAVAHPIEGPLKKPVAVESLVIPDPDAPERLGDLPRLVKRFKGRIPVMFGQRAFFLWAVNMSSFENVLMWLILEPKFMHELFDRILETSIRLARNAIRAGADIIVETDDYAFNSGPLVSPQIFAEFMAPRMKKYAAAIHEEGGYLLKHTDGNVTKILDLMVDAGIDGLQSIDPIAGMDIGLIKEKYGKKISLWGNVDCGNLMAFGSEKDIEEAVKDVLRRAAKGGGFVLTSCNSIPTSANPANYAAMIKYGHEYGKYPISV